MVKIIPFQIKYQEKVNLLLAEIAKEFPNPILSPSTKHKNTTIDKYWIALQGELVVGTIAIVKLKQKNAMLKKMFVAKAYRGKEKGIANLLLNTVFEWCKQEQVATIFLGTMLQFKGAHRFYEKNGFREIDRAELPMDFVFNLVDEVFYVRDGEAGGGEQ